MKHVFVFVWSKQRNIISKKHVSSLCRDANKPTSSSSAKKKRRKRRKSKTVLSQVINFFFQEPKTLEQNLCSLSRKRNPHKYFAKIFLFHGLAKISFRGDQKKKTVI